ncbi:unnamed protein product [Effrenium voratum]|uniref:Tyrosine-protein phosphatase domain-containing protein n=1 Tax=Effrenium voratum TaxID=2562239 RepID=A0AA36ML93_9DINO|nr:unnamed protein product [Effrenium voratum]
MRAEGSALALREVVGLRTLQREKEPEASVRLQVYEKLLGEAMAPKMYNMLAAGSKYVVSTSTNGITITFVGYQEAMSKLINRTLNVFNSFNEHLNTTLPSRFHRIAKTYREELETFGGMPSSYAIQDMERLLMRNRFSNHESLEALSKINLTAAARAGGDLLLSKELKMTALAIGNLADLESTDALHEIASSLARPSWTVAQPSPVDGRVEEVQPVVNVQKPVEVRTLNPRPGDPNDVAIVSLVYGVGDVPSRVILSIASSLLGTAAFDHLRTQQQLGPFLSPRTVVQGTKVSADEAEAAIEGLLTTTMPKILRELTVEDFQSQVDAYRQQLLEPPLAASDEVSHFWGHITQGGRCMNLLDKALSFLKSPQCNKQMLIDTWNDLAFGNVKDGKNALRKKISVKYFAQKDGSDTAPKRPTLQEARAAWQKHGVPPAATELLEREWSETKTVAASNSKVRQELAEEGGFFPTDLHCGGEAGGAEAGVVMRQAGMGCSTGRLLSGSMCQSYAYLLQQLSVGGMASVAACEAMRNAICITDQPMTQPKWLFAASMSFPQFPSDEEEWLAGLHHDDFAKRQMMATVLRFGPLAPNCGFQLAGPLASLGTLTALRRAFPNQFLHYHAAGGISAQGVRGKRGYTAFVHAKLARILGASSVLLDVDACKEASSALKEQSAKVAATLCCDLSTGPVFEQHWESMKQALPVLSGKLHALQLPLLFEVLGHSDVLATTEVSVSRKDSSPGLRSFRTVEKVWRAWHRGEDRDDARLAQGLIAAARRDSSLLDAFDAFPDDANVLCPGWRQQLADEERAGASRPRL